MIFLFHYTTIQVKKESDKVNDIKRASLYIRVSTDDQTEYSPDSQIKLCYKYAKEHDLEIDPQYIFKEDGISGTNIEKRESFKRMIAIAKTKPKPFDVILVYSFSRFARNREDSIMYKSLLRKKLGIEVISITQPLSEGKESILMEALYEAMDEYYSVDLAEQSIRGKLEKASRGEHQGNKPYGYDYDKNTKQLYINEEQAKIVRFIFEEWIKQDTTIRSLCRTLNNMNILTTRGCKWADRSIYLILQNPAYIGYSRFCKGGMKRNYDDPSLIIRKGTWKPIISNELWEKAQTKMNIHKKENYKYKSQTEKKTSWLRGIVKCSSCGSSLVRSAVNTVNNPNRAVFYQCTGFVKGRCRNSHYIREDVLMPTILEEIKKTYTKKINITIKHEEPTSNNNELMLLKEQLSKIESRMIRIKEAYINEIDTLEEYKENKSRLEIEKKKIEEQIQKYDTKKIETERKEKTYNLCKTAYEILSDPNQDFDRKDIISHQLFDKIIYDKKANTLTITYKGI